MRQRWKFTIEWPPSIFFYFVFFAFFFWLWHHYNGGASTIKHVAKWKHMRPHWALYLYVHGLYGKAHFSYEMVVWGKPKIFLVNKKLAIWLIPMRHCFLLIKKKRKKNRHGTRPLLFTQDLLISSKWFSLVFDLGSDRYRPLRKVSI